MTEDPADLPAAALRKNRTFVGPNFNVPATIVAPDFVHHAEVAVFGVLTKEKYTCTFLEFRLLYCRSNKYQSA